MFWLKNGLLFLEARFFTSEAGTLAHCSTEFCHYSLSTYAVWCLASCFEQMLKALPDDIAAIIFCKKSVYQSQGRC
jgi:hypothetical protein